MRILVIDDDPRILKTLEIMLSGDGHEVTAAPDAESALEALEHRSVDVAFVDIQLPGIDGVAFLRKLRDQHRDVEAVMITAYGTVDVAVECMKEGAFDFLTKPFQPDQIRLKIRQVEKIRGLREEVTDLKRKLAGPAGLPPFFTRTPAVLHVIEMARTAAETEATVLVMGESGTGKSLLARHIHDWSQRRDGPFTLVDCTSFQETLLESELFGHARGAFTGAVADKTGKVEAAQKGTLFLEEVGDVAPSLQGKLLRLVEDRTFERLGDPAPRSMDARIIAATNHDLDQMVEEGEFRKDLYYRLSVVEITLPALRHRPADILPLAQAFLAEFNRTHERKVEDIEEDVRHALTRYAWPGNVRELSHLVERAVLACPGRSLRREHFPDRLFGSDSGPAQKEDEITPLSILEENQLRKALSLHLSMEETSRRLGINPSTLWRKRKKYGL
jgi:NtrC-family two-component system response regulator AlgB